jgi:hypothetical protein
MTLRYTHVSQVDLQRQYNQARAYLANRYRVPYLESAREETEHPLAAFFVVLPLHPMRWKCIGEV